MRLPGLPRGCAGHGLASRSQSHPLQAGMVPEKGVLRDDQTTVGNHDTLVGVLQRDNAVGSTGCRRAG